MFNYANLNPLTERKKVFSIFETDSFRELPETNPLAIVDKSYSIIHFNQSFRDSFKLDRDSNLSELESEPDLVDILQSLSSSNYNGFQFDVVFASATSLTNREYSVEIERIIINGEEYFFLLFNSLKDKSRIENRINNLHNALEHGKIPVIITSDEGNVSYVTLTFEEILKSSIDEIFNNSLSSVLSKFFNREELVSLEEAITHRQSWTKKLSIIKESQLKVWELKLNPIFIEANNTLNFILTANDITDYILKNQIIKKSEDRLRSIINNISDLLLIIKKENNNLLFENANDNFCKIFSVQKNKAIKKDINTTLPKNFSSEIYKRLDINDQDNEIVDFNFTSLSQRRYHCKVTSVDDHITKERIFIVSLKDMTDQILYQTQLKKAYEKEIHLNKLKTALLENLSHEIRTPFNAVLGYSEIIEECLKDGDYETIHQLTSSVSDVLSRILNLFTNIVEVSQLESGEVELESVPLNCNQIMLSVYNKKNSDAAKKNLLFKTQLEKEELIANVDWMKLEKVVLSLVDNAIKYTKSGEVLLQSKLLENEVQLIISDTGKGIEVEHLGRLFEPFAQEEEGYLRNYEGAGLGLTIANGLTKMMNGILEIQSESLKGTIVTITFPRVKDISE